jgi:hypothetical protein
MPAPQATTSISQSHDALHKLFVNWANTSFEKSIVILNEQSFYTQVQTKLDGKVNLTDDLPELKTLKPSVARATIKRLIKEASDSVDDTWQLKPTVAKLFRTTIRSSRDDLSLLPCFDVEYKAETAMGVVTVNAKTWRRNVTVTIDGKSEALDFLHGQVVIAGMRGHPSVKQS